MKKTYIEYTLGMKTREQLFEVLWHSNGKKISWYISQFIKEDDILDDLFQEVMMKLYNTIDSYKPFYSFNTWMYTVVRNHCLDNIKLKHIKADSEIEVNYSNGLSAEDETVSKVLLDEIKTAFERLPLKEKEIAYLRIYEEKTFREIAGIVKEKTSTVKAAYQRAQKKLQYYLKDYNDER